MAEVVYVLCALTSVTCSVLLFRGFAATKSRLLFWSGLCFLGLGLNNVMLFVDLVLMPGVDLAIVRACLALTSMSVLLFGLVWEWK